VLNPLLAPTCASCRALAAAALVTTLAAGAAGPAGAQAKAGLTGLWLLDQKVYDSQEDRNPPLKPELKAAADATRKATRDGGVVLSENGRKCLPIGMPGFVTNEFALKFLETPGEVTVLSENSTLPRTIYLNRKINVTDQDPSWNGHSIGHWEGKTLVVDTIGLNDRTSHITGARGLTSLNTHITERYHLENGGKTLVNAMTFDDSKLLTKPFTVHYSYHRADRGAELWEYVCEADSAGWSERFQGDPQFKGNKPPGPQASN
jgi:hypothetical protein